MSLTVAIDPIRKPTPGLPAPGTAVLLACTFHLGPQDGTISPPLCVRLVVSRHMLAGDLADVIRESARFLCDEIERKARAFIKERFRNPSQRNMIDRLMRETLGARFAAMLTIELRHAKERGDLGPVLTVDRLANDR